MTPQTYLASENSEGWSESLLLREFFRTRNTEKRLDVATYKEKNSQ
jgi:hypothetical protein